MNYAPERPTLPSEEPRMPRATFDASYPSYPMPSHLSRNLPSSMQDEGLQHTTSMGLDSLSLGAGAGGRNYAIPGMGPDTLGGAMGSRAFGIPGLSPDGLGAVGINELPGIGSMNAFEGDSGGATGSRAFSTPGVALDAPGASRYGMSGMALEGPGVAGSRAFSTPIGFLDAPGAARSRAFGVPGSIPGMPGMPDPSGVAGSRVSLSPMAFDAPGAVGSRTFPMPGMAPDHPDPGSGFTIPKIDLADPGQKWSLPMTNVAAGPTGLDLGLDRPNIQKEANYSFPTAGSFVAEAYQEGVPSYASESRHATPCELPLGRDAAIPRFSGAPSGTPGHVASGESHLPGGAVEGCGNKPIADTGYAATNGFGSSYPPPGRGDTYSGGTMSYGPPPERPGGGLPSACLPAFLHLPAHSMSAPYGALPPENLGVPRMPPPLPCYAGPGFNGEPEGYSKALGSFSLPGAHLQPPLGGPCPASIFAIPSTGSFIADASMLGSPNPSLLTGFASGFEQKGEPRSVSKSVQVSPDSPMARGNASPPAKAAPRPVTKQSKKKTNRTCC